MLRYITLITIIFENQVKFGFLVVFFEIVLLIQFIIAMNMSSSSSTTSLDSNSSEKSHSKTNSSSSNSSSSAESISSKPSYKSTDKINTVIDKTAMDNSSLLSTDGAIANEMHEKLQHAFAQLAKFKNELFLKEQINKQLSKELENQSLKLDSYKKSSLEYQTLYGDEYKMRMFWQKRADSLNLINENAKKACEKGKLKRGEARGELKKELIKLNGLIHANK